MHRHVFFLRVSAMVLLLLFISGCASASMPHAGIPGIGNTVTEAPSETTAPTETEPPATLPQETIPTSSPPEVTEPTVTEPSETEPRPTEPPEPKPPKEPTPIVPPTIPKPLSCVPVVEYRQVDFQITVTDWRLPVRSGPGAEYDQTGELPYGTKLHITQLHGSINALWGFYDEGWVSISGTDLHWNDTVYRDHFESSEIFSNTPSSALPLTVIHKLITEHFHSPLPEGKTTKKVIYIGYDGFRPDTVEIVSSFFTSGIGYLQSKGGLYHAFTGGIPGVKEQPTETAPSWMAATTGGWYDYTGIWNNGSQKSGVKTFITSIAEEGKSAAMVAAWGNHLYVNYLPDLVYAQRNKLPIKYVHTESDAETYPLVYSYVSKQSGVSKSPAEDPDVIFCIFDDADAAGHVYGYGNRNKNYLNHCRYTDTQGYYIIRAIESRDTFDQEDWLILMSTDHGGISKTHGGQSDFERMVWIACNKNIDLSWENLHYALTP